MRLKNKNASATKIKCMCDANKSARRRCALQIPHLEWGKGLQLGCFLIVRSIILNAQQPDFWRISDLQHDVPVAEFSQWSRPQPCQPKMRCLFTIDCSFYRFIGLTNHTGCWENTRKVCKSLFHCSQSTNILSVLLTYWVVYHASKRIESAVCYFCN